MPIYLIKFPYFYLQKTDSGDSGNEEPHGEADFYVKKNDTRSMERVYIPTAPKVDKLAERMTNLSCPRDYQAERVPEELVDSLPPEGREIIQDRPF